MDGQTDQVPSDETYGRPVVHETRTENNCAPFTGARKAISFDCYDTPVLRLNLANERAIERPTCSARYDIQCATVVVVVERRAPIHASALDSMPRPFIGVDGRPRGDVNVCIGSATVTNGRSESKRRGDSTSRKNEERFN